VLSVELCDDGISPDFSHPVCYAVDKSFLLDLPVILSDGSKKILRRFAPQNDKFGS
jgi:hypothetical protein